MKLNRCPFCGKLTPVMVDEDMGYDAEMDAYIHSNSFQVVCDITNGGCGGSGGYRINKDEAVSNWNTRAAIMGKEVRK